MISGNEESKTGFEKDFVKIGHRGACGYELENSMASFRKALDLGVDAIELDVHACKTGEAIIIHDDTVDRVTGGGKGKVASKTLEEIKSLSMKNGEKIPTLEELLSIINGEVSVNVEIKDRLVVRETAEIIKRSLRGGNWKEEDFIISSFDVESLFLFKKEMPKIKIGALAKDLPLDYEIIKELEAYSVNLPFSIIDEKIVKDFHNMGFRVFVFTVNEYEDILKVKRAGVDGIFSDFPDRL